MAQRCRYPGSYLGPAVINRSPRLIAPIASSPSQRAADQQIATPRRLVAIACVSLLLLPSTGHAQAPPQIAGSTLQLHLDNDEFAGLNRADKWYSSGFQFARHTSSGRNDRGWGFTATRFCPGLAADQSVANRDYWAIGQNIYTQSVRNRNTPLPNDRPIAGFLYVKSGNVSTARNGFASLGLELGVTGPAAFGEEVQNTLHKILGVTEVPAWRYQLRPRLAVNSHYNCSRSGDLGWFGWHASYGLSIGTTIAKARTAIALSYSANKQPFELPTEARFRSWAPAKPPRWAVLIGLRGNWTPYDYLIEGNTYGYQSTVRPKPLTGAWFVSLSVRVFDDWQLRYVYSKRSVDFIGPGVSQANYKSQAIGMITISVPLS